ncbi:MAG TPA: hypothetical protein VF429_06315 [Anaerolineae bacterium]
MSSKVLWAVGITVLVVVGVLGAAAAGFAISRVMARRAVARSAPSVAPRAPIGRGNFSNRAPMSRGRMANQFAARRGFVQGAASGLLAPDVLESVAKTLNLNPADLTTALRGGKTLADLAKSQNVAAAQVQAAIANAQKAALDRAAKDGLIPQARADALKANIDPSKINLTSRRFGMSGVPGRGNLPRKAQRSNTAPSPTPTPTP